MGLFTINIQNLNFIAGKDFDLESLGISAADINQANKSPSQPKQPPPSDFTSSESEELDGIVETGYRYQPETFKAEVEESTSMDDLIDLAKVDTAKPKIERAGNPTEIAAKIDKDLKAITKKMKGNTIDNIEDSGFD